MYAQAPLQIDPGIFNNLVRIRGGGMGSFNPGSAPPGTHVPGTGLGHVFTPGPSPATGMVPGDLAPPGPSPASGSLDQIYPGTDAWNNPPVGAAPAGNGVFGMLLERFRYPSTEYGRQMKAYDDQVAQLDAAYQQAIQQIKAQVNMMILQGMPQSEAEMWGRMQMAAAKPIYPPKPYNFGSGPAPPTSAHSTPGQYGGQSWADKVHAALGIYPLQFGGGGGGSRAPDLGSYAGVPDTSGASTSVGSGGGGGAATFLDFLDQQSQPPPTSAGRGQAGHRGSLFPQW